ncbi:MAG TPA: class I SAM-dependent methyltransferase [Syntrophales bacterium]|nr:class I SAM-dependent methyltransferase [Syntrophales bacterium]
MMNQSVESRRCPYCLEQAFPGLAAGRRRFFHCSSCRLVFRDGLDAPEAAAEERRYYEDEYFRELAWDQLEGYRDGIYREALDRIEGQEGRRGRLLDVGCGCGLFLREALKRGWDAKGIDPSRESIEYLHATIGDAGIQGTLEDFDPGTRYDAVTMINVLDHLAEPWKDATRAASLLRDGGVLYVRVPNGPFHMALCRLLASCGLNGSTGRVVVFHNYVLSAAWLTRVLSDRGFSRIEIRNAGLSGFSGYRRHTGRTKVLHALRRAVWCGAKSAERLSAGRLLWGPSLEVTARKAGKTG